MIYYVREDLMKSDFWDLFTSKEEYNPIILDRYERFPYYLSTNTNILEPRVSKYFIEKGLTREYPGSKRFAVCLNHDIDFIHYFKFSRFLLSLLHGKMKEAFTILLSKYSRYNPWWNFTDIMKLEENYNAKSSFYFLALGKGDLDYSFNIEELTDAILNIIDNGWEVGLQGGHTAYKSLRQIKKEKTRLENIVNRKVIGYKNHFLRFKVPDTWELLSKAGFKYDTTFGYWNCVGFRNGMCHPYKPFNLKKNTEIDILEIPLTIMDSALFSHMQLNTSSAWYITKRLIDTVEKYQGVITIVCHNTSMRDENLKFYKKILMYCHEKHAWLTSGEEILKWWHTVNP